MRAISANPGLLIVKGRQHRFSAAEWHSPGQPKPGMEVEAAFGRAGQVTEIVLVPEDPIDRKPLARILKWLSPVSWGNGGEKRS